MNLFNSAIATCLIANLVPIGLPAASLANTVNHISLEVAQNNTPKTSTTVQDLPALAQTTSTILSFPGWLQAQTAINPSLTEALENYLKKQDSSLEETNYRSAEIDINGDNKKDALVLLLGSYWCGSGGCTMLVFQGTGEGFRPVSQITLVREPVIVSETLTKGWRDIIVHVSGGGGESKNVALKFNGSTYPTNPSLEKPLSPATKIRGVEVFPEPQP